MLYADPILPRSIVNDVILYWKNFICQHIFGSLNEDIKVVLRKHNVNSLVVRDVLTCIDNHKKIFSYVDTEAKRMSLLRAKGLIEPEKFIIGLAYEDIMSNDKPILSPVSLIGVQIPLRKSLKAFLEIPGMFSAIYNYMKQLTMPHSIVTNILQSKLWITKYKKKFSKDIVIPLFVFYDDVETGNPLGSHAGTNKFGAVYAMIACLPPWLSSSLDSIIFSSLIRSQDKKATTNAKCFSNLIDELNFLQENGIVISVSGRLYRIKFQLLLILGDNLGLNEIFGFVTSFRTDFCCRVCEADKQAIATRTIENKSDLRTKDKYDQYCKTYNVSAKGIKEPCAFNKVNDFHICENIV